MRQVRSMLAMLLSAGAFIAASPASAQMLDPLDFASLGTLNLSGGAFTINTDTLEIRDGADALLFTGVLDDQRGMADSFGPGGDVTTVGPLGIPHIAVFTFDGITLDATAAIIITGHRALALLSRGGAVIDTTIDVSGSGDQSAGQTGEPGGPGGFAGGTGAQNGFGPGGGSGGNASGFVFIEGGSAGFGGSGGVGGLTGGSDPPGGPVYGNLLALLQGGSGGGGGNNDSTGMAGGGGGGGALEIGAAGSVDIGPNGLLLANGGFGMTDPGLEFGGAGSGGGIRVHGEGVSLLGAISAAGARGGANSGSGGGRVLIGGSPESYFVGSPPLVSTTGISVADGEVDFIGSTHGLISVMPLVTVVTGAQTFELGTVLSLQTASDTQPGVELVPGDLQVFGEVTVPAAGATNTRAIKLESVGALITGGDPLTNAKVLRGTGSVQTPVTNIAGAQINAVNDLLTFTQPVTNDAAAQINAIGSTLAFMAGLTNDGDLNLINSTIIGPLAARGTTALGGVNHFRGDVTGDGDFTASGQAVFEMLYAPDPDGLPSSSTIVMFGGSAAFGPDATLMLDVDGLTPASEHDQLTITSNANLDGTLELDLAPGFSLMAGQRVELILAGAVSGTFAQITGAGGLNVAYLSDRVTLGPACPGDNNHSGTVNVTDLLSLLAAWGACAEPCPPFCAADTNSDCLVNVTDLLALLAGWGACP